MYVHSFCVHTHGCGYMAGFNSDELLSFTRKSLVFNFSLFHLTNTYNKNEKLTKIEKVMIYGINTYRAIAV